MKGFFLRSEIVLLRFCFICSLHPCTIGYIYFSDIGGAWSKARPKSCPKENVLIVLDLYFKSNALSHAFFIHQLFQTMTLSLCLLLSGGHQLKGFRGYRRSVTNVSRSHMTLLIVCNQCVTKSLLAFLLIWIRLAITANATDSSHQVSIVWSCKPILPTSLVDLLEPRDDDEEESEEEQDDEVNPDDFIDSEDEFWNSSNVLQRWVVSWSGCTGERFIIESFIGYMMLTCHIDNPNGKIKVQYLNNTKKHSLYQAQHR